ncbi:hypothetical protein GJAV_G00021590 [Gymnothorax javanicus]|nr:hypothetical protein GJAV_G00021590 [Gymnothorax javanicus]
MQRVAMTATGLLLGRRKGIKLRNNPDIEPQGAHHYREQQYYHGAEPGFGPGINSDSSSQGSSRTNQFFESGYLETPSPGSYGHRMDYMSPSSSRENIHELVNRMDPKRGGMNHLYGGQTSSPLLNPPAITEAGLNQQPQDTGTKQGLRKWRINSYLSALDDGDKGLSGPLESDPFEEPPRFPEENYVMELPAVKPNPQELPMMAVSKDLISKYARTNQPDVQKAQTGKYAPVATDGKVATEVPEPSTATKDKIGGKEEVKKVSESSTTKQESHPSRINPLFQRGSRLRSSLLFSSINFEQNDSAIKSSAGDNNKEGSNEEASEHLKSSVVAHILEKRPSMKREKIDWSSLRKTTFNENKGQKSEEQSSVPAESKISADTQQSTATTTASSKVTKGILMKPKDYQNISSEKELHQDDTNTEKQKFENVLSGASSMGPTDPKNLGENKPVNWSSEKGTEVHKAPNQQSEESTEESSVKPPKDSVPLQKPKLTEKTQLKVPPEREIIPVPTEPLPAIPSFINMDDPEMRFLYFKRLAAERKAANKAKESTIVNPAIQESITDTDHKTPSASQNLDNTDEKVADKSVTKKVPVDLEGVQNPTETQTSKALISQFISNKPGEAGLMDKELVRDSTVTKTRPIEKISEYGITSTEPVKSMQNKPISSVSDNRTAAHDVASQKSKGLMEESHVKSPVEKDATEKPKSEPLPKDPPQKETAPTESVPSTSSLAHVNDQGLVLHSNLVTKQNASDESSKCVVRSSGQSEKTSDGMKLAGKSIDPANANLKKTAVSKKEKEPPFQGAARYPLEALANMPISNTSEKPILYKAEVTLVPEPKNKSPVVIPQSAVSDLRYKDSEPDVAVASNSSPKSVEKDSVKPQEGPQGPNISNSKGIDQHATDAEKQDFKKDNRNHAASLVLNDPGKELQEKPSHSRSGKGTAVLEITEQKSVEATGQSMNLKSLKDHLPSHKPKPVETEQPNTAPVEKHVTTAPKLPVPTASSSITDRETAGLSSKSLAVKQNNLDGPMESVAEGPDLSKSTSDNSLKTPNASQKLSEANLETTDISPTEKEPEIHKAAQNATETLTNNTTDQNLLVQGESVPPKSGDPTQAVLKQQTELTLECKASQPHSSVPEATKDSVKSVEKDSKQVAEVASKEEKDDHKTQRPHSSAASKGSQSPLQTLTNSVIHSCNLKDDTKVILEQISANSQNRIDLTVSTEGTTDDAKMEKEKGSSDKKGIPETHLRGSRVQDRLDNRSEREDLLKKMEKMRKEKRVYSRFELG